MFSPTEQKAAFAILLHAALADGAKSDAERAALKRMSEGFAAEAINPWTVYQEVLGGRYPVEHAAADLPRREARLLAYEMALGVCDTDGPPEASERAFLARLRSLLGMATQADAAGAAETAAEQVAAAVPTGVAAGAPPPPLPTPAASPERMVPVNTAELEKSVLNHAILTGALELLPQSLATMAIVPLQMKLVYGVGKAHGYPLDRGHIRDFMATAGAGLAAQAVEGYARKLVGGLVGGLLGKGLVGGLGRAAVSTGTGAAITFASTFAIGRLAIRYYGGGRKMEMIVLKNTYSDLLVEGRRLFGQHSGDIERRASTLTSAEVINLVRQP